MIQRGADEKKEGRVEQVNPPVAPEPPSHSPQGEQDPPKTQENPPPDPTRYGDWERGGRCVDF